MNAERNWEWRTIDPDTRVELRRSADSFSTLFKCVNDAALHGYERRSDGRRAGEGRSR